MRLLMMGSPSSMDAHFANVLKIEVIDVQANAP